MELFTAMLLAFAMHRGECSPVVSPPRHTARPGESVRMQCSIGTALVESSLISWYRERPCGVLEPVTQFIRQVLTNGRYTGEIHNENGSFFLTIGNVQRNDSGLYFCIVRASGTFIPGRSSRLVVTDPQITPSVQLFSPGPSEDEMGWTEPVLVVCLVRDASPLWGPVFWTIPGVSAEPTPRLEEVLTEPDSAYTVTSHITVSVEQWESGGVVCEVHNNVTGEVYTSGNGTHGNSIFGEGGTNCLHVLYYGLPGVCILCLIVVTSACFCRKRLRTEQRSREAELTAHHSGTRQRKTKEDATEYASLNLIRTR
ncbi:immunoglobulin alpha-2 heavy chain-like isoform X1 [Acipenser ruthenus]|uniref:immunoglobulin alpha-2 heavy chain-like isoform X1 n=1 Tax=Acipenser ruthenus TaxID=7906 RepID=UPI0027412BCE|nr:immunoglobulin alpha-2 heavy chain-like isoform X1 [Acipenser ruthenus]